MKKITQLTLILSIFFGLFSCTMVKQPQASNFQAVKYNSNLRLAKKVDQNKLTITAQSFENDKKVKEERSKIDIIKTNNEYKNVLTASSKQASYKTKGLDIKPMEENVSAEDQNKTHSVFNKIHLENTISPISSYLENPMPAAASNGDLGNLLYIILVVVLVLIVFGFLNNLSGGLIGVLITVLVILLILRLLGIV